MLGRRVFWAEYQTDAVLFIDLNQEDPVHISCPDMRMLHP
jgi:hypothetical protein